MKLYHFFLLGCTLGLPGINAQLLSDRPMPIDQLLQMVWDPSALIQVWTALDQLYNIALGWRSAAKTVVTLPFRQGRSMDHVKFQEPRHLKYGRRHRQMDAPHWERFNEIYSGQSSASAQVPIRQQHVMFNEIYSGQPSASAQMPLRQQHALFNEIYSGQPSASAQMHVRQQHGLPPPQFFFNPQEIFPPGWTPNLPLANRDDKRLRDIKHFLQTKAFLDKLAQNGANMNGLGHQPNVPVPLLFSSSNGALTSNPETRLRMFLKLLKQLGDMHASRVDFDDSKEENRYNR